LKFAIYIGTTYCVCRKVGCIDWQVQHQKSLYAAPGLQTHFLRNNQDPYHLKTIQKNAKMYLPDGSRCGVKISGILLVELYLGCRKI